MYQNKQETLIIWKQFFQKGYFRSKIEKMSIIEFHIIS